MVLPQLFIALDHMDAATALAFADTVWAALPEPQRLKTGLKVGMELFYSAGPGIISALHQRGAFVFVDLKLHDIPNTAAQASKALVQAGAQLLNVHAGGGLPMMQAVCEAVSQTSPHVTVLAVTVLTSFDAPTLQQAYGSPLGIEQTVATMAQNALQAGCHGVVCSPLEAHVVQATCGDAFLRVCPGIRLPQDACHDQVRQMSPHTALQHGATQLVMGRPITQAPNPLQALQMVFKNLEQPLLL